MTNAHLTILILIHHIILSSHFRGEVCKYYFRNNWPLIIIKSPHLNYSPCTNIIWYNTYIDNGWPTEWYSVMQW